MYEVPKGHLPSQSVGWCSWQEPHHWGAVWTETVRRVTHGVNCL